MTVDQQEDVTEAPVLHGVLLVEDDEAYASYVEALLARRDPPVRCHWQPTLREGLAAVREHEYDTILLDLSLPDAGRLRAIQSMIEVCDGTPIVVVTNTDDDDLAAEALFAGAQDYLVKGHSDSLLLHTVARAITRQRAMKSLVSDIKASRPDLPPAVDDRPLAEADPEAFEQLVVRYRDAILHVSERSALKTREELRRYLSHILGEIAADMVASGHSARDAVRLHAEAITRVGVEERPERVATWLTEARVAIVELTTLIADGYRSASR